MIDPPSARTASALGSVGRGDDGCYKAARSYASGKAARYTTPRIGLTHESRTGREQRMSKPSHWETWFATITVAACSVASASSTVGAPCEECGVAAHAAHAADAHDEAQTPAEST